MKVKTRYENYEDEHGQKKTVDDDTLLAAMFEILPKSIEKDVIFNRDPEQSCHWKNIYDAMTNYTDLKQEKYVARAEAKNPNSMDTRWLDNNDLSGMGKSQGKGAGGVCWNFNQPGHQAKDCRKCHNCG